MMDLAVDGLIVVLLSAALGYAAILHRRLKALQAGEPELERLISSLSEVSGGTESAVDALKAATAEAGGRIAADLKRAQELADELRLLTDRADRAAAGLAEAIRSAREPGLPIGPVSKQTTAPGSQGPVRCSRAELEQALNQLR